MSTTAVETLESLQEALDPLSAIRSDQAELGSWIHDSFSALEKLHEELTQWQSELARKETELDLRQDALSKNLAGDKEAGKLSTQLEQELAKVRAELHQLEEENGAQLREFAGLEARCGELEVEHRIATQRVADLEAALEAERERSTVERQLWKEQFERLRDDLEHYYQSLTEQLEKVAAAGAGGQLSHTPLSAGAAHAKSAELRRRAQSRREAKGRN